MVTYSLNVFYFPIVFVCFFTYINTYNLTQYHVNKRVKGQATTSKTYLRLSPYGYFYIMPPLNHVLYIALTAS